MEGPKKEAPSYGLAVFRRVHGSPRYVFGSELRHHDTIRLIIRRAVVQRDLSHEWFFGKQELVEVEFSPTQFASLITTMNVGDGVPCTIKALDNVPVPHEPDEGVRTKFDRDLKEKAREAIAPLKEVRKLLETLNLSAKARNAVVEALTIAEMEVASNMPFLVRQFEEAMDNVVTDAKGQMEAFVMGAIERTGLEVLRQQAPALERPKDEEEHVQEDGIVKGPRFAVLGALTGLVIGTCCATPAGVRDVLRGEPEAVFVPWKPYSRDICAPYVPGYGQVSCMCDICRVVRLDHATPVAQRDQHGELHYRLYNGTFAGEHFHDSTMEPVPLRWVDDGEGDGN